MIYRFKEQNNIGVNGEEVIKEYLIGRGYTIKNVDLSTNKLGCDFFIVYREGDIAVEVKTDTIAHKTGNVFIESISNDHLNKVGWVHSSISRWVIYFIRGENYFFWFDLHLLRSFLSTNSRKFQIKTAQNPGYRSHGYLIPIEELKKEFETEQTK